MNDFDTALEYHFGDNNKVKGVCKTYFEECNKQLKLTHLDAEEFKDEYDASDNADFGYRLSQFEEDNDWCHNSFWLIYSNSCDANVQVWDNVMSILNELFYFYLKVYC